jgi:oxygen-independent coproporphyrinogen III oxidase
MSSATILRYATERLPRYTSYPTAPFFTPAIGEADYRNWIGSLAPSVAASLYIHVPFCKSLCWYCGCHTTVSSDDTPIVHYVDALLAEIKQIASIVPAPLRVTHLHWGGGTPSIVGSSAMRRVMAAIGSVFRLDARAEIAIEIDPRTLTSGMAKTLGMLGFTRASIGLQTFDSVVQRTINRVQSAEITEAAAQQLRESGIGALNIDLIYGLPHQTLASCVATVERALELDPDRFAVFGYAHVPAVKRNQRHLDETALPDAEERLNQAQAIAGALVSAGYRPIGLDHFAKPSDPLSHALDACMLRRNFQGYTTDSAGALLGFGASAIGRLPQGYVQNTARIGAYKGAVLQGRMPVVRGVALTPEDRLRAAVIERLMCDLAVDLDAVAALHGLPGFGFRRERAILADLAKEGLVRIAGTRVAVPESMRPLTRVVAGVFDTCRSPGTTHAQAV